MKQFGICGEQLEQRMDREAAEREEYLRRYPTRWRRFLHWLGVI